MKKGLLHLLAYLLTIVKIALYSFAVLISITLASSFISNVARYPLLQKINRFEGHISQPFISFIKSLMPYRVDGTDYSQLILLVFILILAHLCFVVVKKIRTAINQLVRKKDYLAFRKKASTTLSAAKLSELDSKFEALKTSKKTDRKQMLAEFARLKNELNQMGQQLAFLAIDVVDSTGMKRDEDKHIAAYDFDRYNEYALSCLKENGVVKFATTPDGIMSCFRTVDSAVNAAVSLLNKLEHFNAHEKQMKQDFQIRCGINAGFVYIDDQIPLEQVTDRVIDIAGHMQKQAKPNGINIAATAIEPLKNRNGFNETSYVIDEQKVYEWSPNLLSK
jgi:class 3 adenylate cyclase/uncharacterized protein YggT (Ycf19 family)